MKLVLDTGILGELCHPKYARSRIRLFAEKIRHTEGIVIYSWKTRSKLWIYVIEGAHKLRFQP